MKHEPFLLTKPVQNEQLVRQLDGRRHRELFMVAITGLAFTAAVIAYAWPHFELIRLGYRMEELLGEREALLEERQHLELQRATELAPARIETIAKEELGMVYPDASHLLNVLTYPSTPFAASDPRPETP